MAYTPPTPSSGSDDNTTTASSNAGLGEQEGIIIG